MIESDTSERKELFNFIKSIYNFRSKYVHGKIEDVEKDIVFKIEEILRNSLLFFMDHPDKFTTENLNAILFE